MPLLPFLWRKRATTLIHDRHRLKALHLSGALGVSWHAPSWVKKIFERWFRLIVKEKCCFFMLGRHISRCQQDVFSASYVGWWYLLTHLKNVFYSTASIQPLSQLCDRSKHQLQNRFLG